MCETKSNSTENPFNQMCLGTCLTTRFAFYESDFLVENSTLGSQIEQVMRWVGKKRFDIYSGHVES